mmetsp:Transcript_81758/g.231464  ORF Transcript_81758/g.231464 Transcript_81758/m.231464 type:complete len:139 (-) Transcript_81758:67-483(-)
MGWGGSGKGGNEVWMPHFQKQSWSSGKGDGKDDGKGKGKGKGHKSFRPEQKAWLGGLPMGAEYRELHEHLKPAGAKWVEIFDGNGQGTGVVCFASAEDAQNAIATFNGTPFMGVNIQLDVWETKPRQPKGESKGFQGP